MYISKLKIHNYRNFKDFEIRLKPLTLVIGENNIGKSNLLDAIGLIFSQDVSYYKKRVLDIADFNHDCVRDLKRSILNTAVPVNDIIFPVIKVTATLVDWSADQEGVICDWYSNSEFTEAELTYQFSPSHSFNKEEEITQQRTFIANFITKIGQAAFDALSESDKLSIVNFPIAKYYYSIYGGFHRDSQVNTYHLNQIKFELLDALRDAEVELVASQRNRLLFRILNSKEETEYQDLKTQLIGLQEAVDSNAALQSIKTGISTQLEKISLANDSTGNLIDLIFAMPEVDEILKKISIIYGSNPIKIERNGTGRNNLLFISLVLSFVEDTTRAQSSFFRIIGLEEPEAHLHPNLQDHLAANLENLIKIPGQQTLRKDIQLLVTSHSTQVTTKIDFENTVVLYFKDAIVTPHYILEGFDTSTDDKKTIRYLNKYLDAVNTNMFYSRKIILVEGISEKLLLPCFFKILHAQTLEKASCCIVNVNGVAFSHFLDIVRNGYFTKCLVLTDSDIGTATADRSQHLVSEYSGVAQIRIGITTTSTFEKDIIASNLTGAGRDILLKVLKQVRPISGKKYFKDLSTNPIDTTAFFALIVEFKSEFAYRLSIELSEDHTGFVIPTYIRDGLQFLMT